MSKRHPRIVTTDEEIHRAVARGNVYEDSRPRAVSAEYRDKVDIISVKLASGVELLIPRFLLQGLEDADKAKLKKVAIVGGGSGLHWESLDVDHHVPSLIEGVFGSRRWMSEIGKRGGAVRSKAKAAAARKNGRKGGRPRKAIV
jgi:hypothetical protein